MSGASFRGRAVLPGVRTGPVRVSRSGVNLLATYRKALVLRSRAARGGDPDNPELYGRPLAGRILCLPRTIGSTSGGLVLQTAAHLGMAPAALLFSEPIDSLAAAGVLLADIWCGVRIVTVDGLGAGFLDAVRDGTEVAVAEDGTVRIVG